MVKKRTKSAGLKKLPDFFQSASSPQADSASPRGAHPTASKSPAGPSPPSDMMEDSNKRGPSSSSPPLPASKGPSAKKGLFPSNSPTSSATLSDFPEDTPLITSVLKSMLYSLQHNLTASMDKIFQQLQAHVDDLGARTDHMENKMGEYASAHNELVDAYNSMEEEVRWLKEKLVDQEDRSRRNNIKFRGIPEDVSTAELIPYLQGLFKTIIPTLSTLDMTVDRAHRLPKGKSAPEVAPRDVLIRIHFYHIKERLLQETRKRGSLPSPYSEILLFPNLSATTLQLRRQFQPLISVLRDNQIRYKWGFPIKLIVSRNGTTHVIASPKEGLTLLRSWDLELPNLPASPRDRPSTRVRPDWSKA